MDTRVIDSASKVDELGVSSSPDLSNDSPLRECLGRRGEIDGSLLDAVGEGAGF